MDDSTRRGSAAIIAQLRWCRGRPSHQVTRRQSNRRVSKFFALATDLRGLESPLRRRSAEASFKSTTEMPRVLKAVVKGDLSDSFFAVLRI